MEVIINIEKTNTMTNAWRRMETKTDKDSQMLFQWNSHNLSKQLLFDSGSSSPGAFFPFTLSISDLVRGRLKIEVMLKIA